MYKRLLLVFLLLLAYPAAVTAAPVVYPVKEVVGFDAAGLQAKSPAFAGWLKETGIPALSSGFVAAVKKEFGPVAVEAINAGNKHRVLVASLQLVRTSQYSVPKILSHCTEYQLPITLSLVFTNPGTGDVVYSFTDTSYRKVELYDAESGEERDAQLAAATAENYRTLLERLVHRARVDYNPSQIDASVAKIWKGLYILDKGSKYGIARNDNLTDPAGNEIQVKYAAEDYAVAVPLLVTKVATGQKFSKYADQSLIKTLKKPKVISMQEGWGDETLQTIARYFDAELSKESAFTILPVNENFSKMLSALARETEIGQYQVTNQRALPDYLMKFAYTPPRVYKLSDQGKFGFRIYEQYVLGELLDKQGRILYSAAAGDRIEDKDVEGMVLGRNARLEIVLKNAVKKLAEEFAHSIKFSNFVLPVRKAEGTSITLTDDARQLRRGNTVRIFRNIGEVEGIAGQVVVPIWEAEVTEASGGAATASLLLPVADEVKEVSVSSDDVVIIDAVSAGSTGQGGTSVAYCKEGLSNLGALDIDDFPVLSRAYGYLLPYSLYDNDAAFFQKVSDAVKHGGFNSSSLRLGEIRTKGRCLLPVYKSSVESRDCENGSCDAAMRVAAGYRLYLGKEKKGGAASETKVSIKEIRESAMGPVLQGELSGNVLNMLRDSIVKVRYQ
jgi:hypothetical protein